MSYIISTTGTVPEIVLDDLGARTITHPTENLDLYLEYTEDELLSSDDLAFAVSSGWITVEEDSLVNDVRYYKQDEVDDIVENIDHNSLKNINDDKHRFLSNVMSTGIIKGGRLSINSEDGGLFDVEGGFGVIVNNYTDPENPKRKIVTWPSASGISCQYVGEHEWASVCVTKATEGSGEGSFFQIPDRVPTDEERRDMITLGFVTHISTNEISYIESESCLVTDTMSQLWDFTYNFGPFNIDGNVYTCASGLQLKKTSGKSYDSGTNYINSNKSPNIWLSEEEDPVSEILYYYRDGAGGWVNNDIPTNIVDPDKYDPGDGSLLTVVSGGWTIQTIFFYPPWNATEIQYGQEVYASKEEALSNINNLVDINPWVGVYDIFRGWMIIKQGATNLNCENNVEFVSAGKLGLASTAAGGGSYSGEENSSRNDGTTGIGLVLPKDGVVLPFKSITSTSQVLTISDNESTNSIDLGVDQSKISHSNLANLDSDSHSQYHNDNRGDTRYYTKTLIDGGQLDNRYYTESEVDTISGSLDSKMLYTDGSKQLTADWDVGNFSVTASGFYLSGAKFDAAIFSCSTGALTGGSISKCPEDETKIHVESGTSLYVNMDDRSNPIVEILSWDDEYFYPAISGVDTKWVGIQRTAPGVGGIVVSNKFSQLEKRYITILGRCWNFSGTDVIEGTGNYKAGAFNNSKTVQDLAYALGTINIQGNKYYTTTSGTMRLSRSYGEAFRFSANYDNSNVSPNIYDSLTVEDIDYYTYHIYGTFSVPKTEIDCDYYDNSGVRTAIPTDKWTVQRVYYYPVSSITSVTYGQHLYDSYEDAYANMFTESVNLNRGTMEGTALRAYLIVKQGCDDLTNPTKARLFEAGSIGAFAGGSSGGGGVTDHGALEGLGDDDHAQYILSNGTRNFSSPVKYSYNPTFNNEAQLITKKYVDDIISGLTTDHGELTGLSDDDHPQYHNDARGDARYYTKSQVDTTVSGLTVNMDLASIQVRSTSNLDLTTSYQNIVFGVKDVENNADVLEWSTINTERILIKESGLYRVSYQFTCRTSGATRNVLSRIVLNDITEIPGSYCLQDLYQSETHEQQSNFLSNFSSGDYITLQIRAASTPVVSYAGHMLNVVKLDAVKGKDGQDGAQGDPGSGSTITVRDEGSNVANTPHSVFNFTGSGVSATDAGSGVVTVNIPGDSGLVVQDEGSTVTGGPHGTFNFVGNLITASNAGGGVATVTVSDPIFGSQFSSAADESETNTNSTSPVTKVTLSVTGIPEGNYRIGWYYEWRRNSTSNRYRATVVIDGTTTIMEHDQEPQDVNNFHTNSGFYIGSLSSGNHTIVLGHYGNSTGSTSYTRGARLEIWRVS